MYYRYILKLHNINLEIFSPLELTLNELDKMSEMSLNSFKEFALKNKIRCIEI